MSVYPWIAYLLLRFELVERRMADMEERVGVLEEVTGDMRTEFEELRDGDFEDGYLRGDEDA